MLRIMPYLLGLLMLLLTGGVDAQTPENCEVRRLTQPDRHVVHCTGGLVITLDAAAQIGLLADPADPPRVIDVKRGSVLINVEQGTAATQVQTRHAIAAVRGTEYAVELTGEGTAVFVLTGRVRVSHTDATPGRVTLRQGEGVDVVPGQRLEVKNWGEARIRTLLSRFGR